MPTTMRMCGYLRWKIWSRRGRVLRQLDNANLQNPDVVRNGLGCVRCIRMYSRFRLTVLTLIGVMVLGLVF